MGYTEGKVLGSDEGVKLGISGCVVIVTILINIDGITPGVDVGTVMGSLD